MSQVWTGLYIIECMHGYCDVHVILMCVNGSIMEVS